MTVYIRRPVLDVRINGGSVANVLSANCRFDFNQRVSRASFITYTDPGGGNDDDVEIRGGVDGSGQEGTLRFKGVIRGRQFTNNPQRCETICYGYLQRALEYENWEDNTFLPIGGLDIFSLTGTQPDTAANIVTAVLDRCNIPGGLYGGHISSTSTLYGELAIEAFIWTNGRNTTNPDLYDAGETALAFIERFDEIDAVFTGSGGGRYRTFETLGGNIYRFLVGGRPRDNADTFGRTNTFTQGQDVLSADFQRSTTNVKTYFLVTGYDSGHGLGPVFFPADGDPGFGGSGKKTYRYSNPMIERAHDSDIGNGMSCQTLANSLSLDYNRELVTGSLTTFLDDPFGPAQTHTVLLPDHGISEPLWVQGVEISIDNRGFRQRISYLGGGAPDGWLPDPPG